MLIAGILYTVSISTIPATLQGQLPLWVPLVLAMCGGISQFLKEFAGMPKEQQQTVLDSLHAFAQAYTAMSPDQQSKLLAELPTLLPLLSAVTAKPPS